jgi:hypothetical protein
MTDAQRSRRVFDDCFIVMSADGIQRMTKRAGKLGRGELAIKVRIFIPEQCFAEPDVQVTINVLEAAIIKPAVDVSVLDPAAEQQATADQIEAARRAAFKAQGAMND